MPTGNREKLLEAGIEVLSRKRFTDMKMEEVAALAGVTKPMVYYYFGSKKGFFSELVQHMFGFAREAFRGVMPDTVPVKEALKRFMLKRFQLQRESRAYTGAWNNLMQESWRLAEMEITGRKFFQEVFQPVFDRAVREGEIRPDIKPELVIAVLGSVVEVALERHHGDTCGKRSVEQLVDDVTDLVFNGINLKKVK